LAGEDVSGSVARVPVEALEVDEDEVREAATLAEARKAEWGGGGGTASPWPPRTVRCCGYVPPGPRLPRPKQVAGSGWADAVGRICPSVSA
jgi:hypothetical protein